MTEYLECYILLGEDWEEEDGMKNNQAKPQGVRVIAIDGRCCAGKSTLARDMAERLGAGVVHMDDFFLPVEMRTPARLALPGGNFHHERFVLEVLPFLRGGAGFSYRIFDCGRMDFDGVRVVAPSSLRVVEGAYAHHPVLGAYMDTRIFMDIGPEVQRKRVVRRNGAEAAGGFFDRWIPMEEAYIRAYEIMEKADVIL